MRTAGTGTPAATAISCTTLPAAARQARGGRGRAKECGGGWRQRRRHGRGGARRARRRASAPRPGPGAAGRACSRARPRVARAPRPILRERERSPPEALPLPGRERRHEIPQVGEQQHCAQHQRGDHDAERQPRRRDGHGAHNGKPPASPAVAPLFVEKVAAVRAGRRAQRGRRVRHTIQTSTATASTGITVSGRSCAVHPRTIRTALSADSMAYSTIGYSPYGTQMFLTWVACAQELLAPRPARGSNQSRPLPVARPGALHVAGREPLDLGGSLAASRSTRARPRRRARRAPRASSSRVPVTMLTTPRRHVGGVEHLVEVGGRERPALARAPRRRVLPMRDGGRHQRDEAEQRRLVGADDAHHADRLVHRERDVAERRVRAPRRRTCRPRRRR